MADGRPLFPADEAVGHEPPYPLLCAAEAGDGTTVRALLDARADVNLRDDRGWSPLIMASKEGHAELVRLLLEAGASVNPPDTASHTALRGAAIFARIDCMRLLLAARADPEHPSAGGRTPLMAVRRLRDRRARPHRTANPLARPHAARCTQAAMHGHADAVALLLAHGAGASVRNDAGESAAELAEQRGHTECVTALRAATIGASDCGRAQD